MTIPELNILNLIPQRPPFVMVDTLTQSDEAKTITKLVITPENILVNGSHFSEAGLIENIAQTAAARAGYTALQQGKPVQTGFIGAIKNLQVFALPQPVTSEWRLSSAGR